jgi:HEPN domain-containing protein
MEELIKWVRAYPGQTGKSLVIAKATELLQKEKAQMYSEEEVLEIIRQYALEEHLITSSKPDIWFKQYKKK